MIGKHLSHYLIESELGRGGMGIVYRAKDTKLDRTVAIKVLPSAALTSEDDRARFYREAKAAAALTHPHIAVIHAVDEAIPEDSNTDDVRPFIAMEFVDGQTLEDRIKQGPLPLEEAVRIASEIASALKLAHQTEIVHRDIKSANVMLTNEGTAKVLDFGLAQTAASTKLTRMGSTLGTVAYMSPEQARGEPVDSRTDLYSLGTILYEMIAGRMPFSAEYEQAAIYSILNEDPEPLTALRSGVPLPLETLVLKALRKDRETRYQSAGDLIADLKAIDVRAITQSSIRASTISAPVHMPEGSEASARSTSPVNPKSIAVLVAVAALSALITFVLKPGPGSGADAPPLVLPIEIHSTGNEWSNRLGFDISPDGSSIVYSTKGTDDVSLYLMQLGQTERIKLEGTSRAIYPQFDPTGKFILFIRDDGLFQMPVTGGFPEPLLSSGTIVGQPGYSVSRSGDILYVPQWGEGIWRRSATGGEPVEVVAPDLDSGEGGFSSPVMLPGGKTILAVRWGAGYNFDIIGIDIETKVRTPIVSGGVSPRYVEPGYLLYSQGDRLLAAAFDPEALELGTPVPIVDDGFFTNIELQRAFYAVSESGSMVYQAGGSEWDENLILQSFAGETRPILEADGVITDFRLSPDGEKLAYAMFTPRRDADIFVRILVTNENIQLTRSNAYDGFPVWQSDSEYLYYSHQPGDAYHIFGTGIVEAATTDTVSIDGLEAVPYAALSDGRLIVRTRQKQQDLSIADPRDDSGKLAPLAVSDDSEYEADLTPDGRYVVYSLSGQGGLYIYARSVDGQGARVLVAQATGGRPRWSPSGGHVYFLDKGDLWKKEHLGDLKFGKTEIVLQDISRYDIWPDESGILTFSKGDSREAFIEFDFIKRLKEIVPPIE